MAILGSWFSLVLWWRRSLTAIFLFSKIRRSVRHGNQEGNWPKNSPPQMRRGGAPSAGGGLITALRGGLKRKGVDSGNAKERPVRSLIAGQEFRNRRRLFLEP